MGDIIFTTLNNDTLGSTKALIGGWVMQGMMLRQRSEVILGQVYQTEIWILCYLSLSRG